MKNVLIIFVILLIGCAAIVQTKSDTRVSFDPAALAVDTIIPTSYDYSLKDTSVFVVQTVLADSLFIVMDIEYNSESVPSMNSTGILTKTETLNELTQLRNRYVRQRQRFRERTNAARDKIIVLDSIRTVIEGG